MTHKRVTASAIVDVKVRIELSDRWGTDCTVEQIKKQASSGAVEKIRNSIKNTRFSIVGEPKVTAVLVDEE